MKKLSNMEECMKDLQSKMSDIITKLSMISIPPEDAGKVNSLVVMMNSKTLLFKFIVRQNGSMQKEITKKVLTGYLRLKEFNDVPNGIYLANQCIEYLSKLNLINKVKTRSFQLNLEIDYKNILTPIKLVGLMEEIYESRKMI